MLSIYVRMANLEAEYEENVNTGATLRIARTEQTHDAKLARLESLCEKAQADMAIAHPSRFGRANAAKFLRDTAENTINYIQANNLSTQPGYGEKLDDLHNMFREAAAAAREACYGKPGPYERSSANLEPLGSLGHRNTAPSFRPRRRSASPRREPHYKGYRRYRDTQDDSY